jgi:hypothetical protein
MGFLGMAKKNGRPPSINSRFFYRELSMADKMVLAAAGKGDISDGFKNVIDCYQVLWNAGYRPEMDLNHFIGAGTDNQK